MSLRRKFFFYMFRMFFGNSHRIFCGGAERKIQCAKICLLMSRAIAQDFAKTNYELLREEQDLILAENAKSIQQNRPDLVQRAMIARQDWKLLVYPFDREMINQNC